MAKLPHTRAAMRALYPVWQVAELAAGYRYTTARVFGEKFRPLATLALGPENVETQRETEEKHHRNTPAELEVHVLRERLAAREQMLEEQAKAIHELREERDEWRKMAQSLHQQTQMLFLPEGRATHAHKRSFWQRVFGKAR